MQIHVVQSGDTIWQLAQNYGTAVNQIVLLNELDNPDVLVVGESLVIPEPGQEYVVQPGNTLWQIGRMFGVTAQELAVANNITDPSLIYPGQMLINPYFPHIVQAGEYIWGIAQQYGVTPEQIIAANDIEQPGLIFPGQTLRIPAQARPVTEVNAYITRVDELGRPEVLRLGRHLTYLSPFTYNITEDGSFTELPEQPVLEAARANNVAPLLVVTNFIQGEFNSDVAAAVLRNPEAQEQLITNLQTVMRSKGYAGVNFDLEYVYPEDRENYNNFLRRVVERLHPEGFLVTTALAPKETADQQGLLYEAHDYQAHGDIVDFVVLMTYEWGWAGGEPWAIAPVNKVRDVLDYAVTVIPRDKIVMGVPLYGRDWNIPWVEGTIASTVNPKEAIQLAARYGVAIQYDETYQSPFFRYVDENGQAHEVWFEDARSVQAKYDTVKEYGLRGVNYWALGTPFPQNWPVLQDNFRIRKL
ncbi:LysM peptidoglycan-binding domain-containing protein [Lentibacillus sp. CBA3610]|uniref:LysM peptidoglycan-binding domain-containing protein n=1 Tax=Lentibacillus sp. CBA3610 TaxID=2518176 RepID=UPI0015950529|nr:LysM peptidoglycan-binding domain-containing protein [Lentibacillus sp. CBA3610]QKY71055.1 LysM peptidoglycan-binding domain-containing protein [Lentibacillus sp. CBA3610]